MQRSMRRGVCCGAPSSAVLSPRRSLPALWIASSLAAKFWIPRLINIGMQRAFGATRDVIAHQSPWRNPLACPQPSLRANDPRSALLAELIKLILNHTGNSTCPVATTDEVDAAVTEWRPHLVILDMDLDGTQVISRLRAKTANGGRLRVIGLTRRGDLRNKLGRGFEAKSDDIP